VEKIWKMQVRKGAGAGKRARFKLLIDKGLGVAGLEPAEAEAGGIYRRTEFNVNQPILIHINLIFRALVTLLDYKMLFRIGIY